MKAKATNKTNKTNKLRKLAEDGKIKYICFDTYTREVVGIVEESSDKLDYKTADGKCGTISNDALIWYRFPGEGRFTKNLQRARKYQEAEEIVKQSNTKKKKLKGAYIVEKAIPLKWWIELQDKIYNKENKERKIK